MVLRFTLTGLIAPVMVLARITQRLQMAKETCVRSGGSRTTDVRGTPLCKRD